MVTNINLKSVVARADTAITAPLPLWESLGTRCVFPGIAESIKTCAVKPLLGFLYASQFVLHMLRL